MSTSEQSSRTKTPAASRTTSRTSSRTSSRTEPKGVATPKRPGKPRNPVAKGSPRASTPGPASPPSHRPSRSTSVFALWACLIVAITIGFTFAVMLTPAATDSLVLLGLLSIPALVTMVFIPQARSTGLYRWPVAWVLGFTSMYPLPMLIATQSWVLIRFWLVEYQPRIPRKPESTSRDAA